MKSNIKRIKNTLALVRNSVDWISDSNTHTIMKHLIPALEDLAREVEEIEKLLPAGEPSGEEKVKDTENS